ncbi:hypothetical protein BJ508DRAFT_324692 [Ascobolus immersus RN42]|uniref:Uncharacterized protein n=1 Tax=Ascobolus immersus RN42 TaxID=1160509 RepID=A0A3N4IFD9_ASCIM|nr:hypothetical protein BJ508DRAFT_324692 [Ascobolus immersus RN42]
MLPTRPMLRLIQEAHPFFRYPTTMRAAPVGASFYLSRMGRTAGFMVPAFALFFGWTIASAKLIDYKNGVYAKSQEKKQ